MEQTQGVPAGASSAESPCQFAIDGGGNLYRRYSEPVCASCVPVMKLTDKWESARVADFNAGWNACRNAMLSAAPQAQPVAEAQAKRADWMKPAAYRDRFADAVARLCCGRRAPDDMIDGWLTPGCEDNRLQHFAADNGPAWAQGIVLLDAADLLAETPTEGVEHGARPTAQSPAQAQPVEAEQAPAVQDGEERRQLQHLIDDIVEEADQDGHTYYRIRDGADVLFSNMVGACARLLAQPAQPVREPMSLEDERALFKAWAGRTKFNAEDIERGRLSGYQMLELNRMWIGWQARAAIGSKGGAESDVSGTGWVES